MVFEKAFAHLPEVGSVHPVLLEKIRLLGRNKDDRTYARRSPGSADILSATGKMPVFPVSCLSHGR